MPHRYAEIMFTEKVKQAQSEYGYLKQNEFLSKHGGPNAMLGEKETLFIQQRDSAYMATVNEDGWPYIQHRGGPRGFLRVLDQNHLAFADFRGNTQMISTGNLAANDRVSLFLMDYAKRQRLKIIGCAQIQPAIRAPSDLLAQTLLGGYYADVERIVTIEVKAFDWNCPQHIQRRYTLDEIEERELCSTSISS